MVPIVASKPKAEHFQVLVGRSACFRHVACNLMYMIGLG